MTAQPWYREPWPWLLMAGPAAVVVAGAVTASLAVISFDGMVDDDYYKQGLAVNRELARAARARELHIIADVQFDPVQSRVRVVLAGDAPRSLFLRLVHPTIPAEDRAATLLPSAPGVYSGAVAAPGARSRVRLEDAERRWSVAGEWKAPATTLRLSAR
jgi:hypothetical protein